MRVESYSVHESTVVAAISGLELEHPDEPGHSIEVTYYLTTPGTDRVDTLFGWVCDGGTRVSAVRAEVLDRELRDDVRAWLDACGARP